MWYQEFFLARTYCLVILSIDNWSYVITLPGQYNLLLELHVPDFELVKEYYLQIGFPIEWERPDAGRRGVLNTRFRK